MAVHANGVLRAILDSPEIFFQMMDYAEQTTGIGSEEFSVSYYDHVLGQTLKRMSPTDSQRAAAALNIANLNHAGLLEYEDEHRDRFLLKPFVIEMLRHLDKSRLKELSDSDLENLRVQLDHARAALKDPKLYWSKDNPDFVETLSTVFTTVRNVVSRIKQNVEALRGQSMKLAELAEDTASENRTTQLAATLEQIFQINSRHIEPTLLFLNPSIDWKGKQPPMQILKDIVEEFETRKWRNEYGTTNRAYLSILGYADQVGIIRRGLDTYLQLYGRQRKVYNNIESRYNDLLDRVRAMHDGKAKFRLKSSDEHFSLAAAFFGLKDYRVGGAARINWPEGNISPYLEEYLRVRHDRAQAQTATLVDASDIPNSDIDRDPGSQRMEHIAAVAKEIKLRPRADIYSQIHNSLSRSLDGYRLPELLEAMHFTPGAEHTVLLSRRKTLTHGDLEMAYFERHLREEASNE